MKTIILNGSPKGDSKECNSMIYARAFVADMKEPCEIRCIVKEDPESLARCVAEFDSVIFILPLYIHAMPGIMMKFIEKLELPVMEGKSLGFIVQAGFMETAQERFVERYFADLALQLGCRYLGTISKGEAAGTYMFPKMFRKVLKMISEIGAYYETNGEFDREIVEKLAKPYKLSKRQLLTLKLIQTIGLDRIGWHQILKKNKAMHLRLDRPFM